MATQSDWIFLRDVLRSLDRKVENGEVVSGPPWDLPSDLTGDMARDYLEATRRRFVEVAEAVKRAWESPVERIKNAGSDTGSILREGAKRAATIAEHIGSSAVEAFRETAKEMEESGKAVAAGIGFGAVLIVVVALLLFRESRGPK